MAKLPEVVVRAGREKKLRAFYPWAQREEIFRADGDIEPGGLATVRASDGSFVGIGMFNSQSRFPLRVLTLQDEPIDSAFVRRRLLASLARRRPDTWQTDAYRACFAEADGLPGLIVDVYGKVAVVQVRALGMERLKPLWLPQIQGVLGVESVYERSEMEGRKEEGLEPFAGPLVGDAPDEVMIREQEISFLVPVKSGLKTGFYLDQRENRRLLRERVAASSGTDRPKVLDLFCYTGGLTLSAAAAGAESTGVDILPGAIELARRNAALNSLSAAFEAGNAFDWLETAASEARLFDFILLDPPALAKVRSKRDSAKWALWKLVYLALPCLKPGGTLLACSCVYQVPLGELIEAVRLAAADRGRRLWVDAITLQPPDHPYLLQFPESLYLKCLWLRAD